MPQLDVTFFANGIIYLVIAFITVHYFIEVYVAPRIGESLKLRNQLYTHLEESNFSSARKVVVAPSITTLKFYLKKTMGIIKDKTCSQQ